MWSGWGWMLTLLRKEGDPAQGFVVHLQSRVEAFISLSFQPECFAAPQPIKSVSRENPPTPPPHRRQIQQESKAAKTRRAVWQGSRKVQNFLFAL